MHPLHTFLVLALFIGHSHSFAADESQDTPGVTTPEEQLMGRWVNYTDSPMGRFTTIKEHSQTQTILTTYDPQGTPVYSHQSDYSVDCTGEACYFTYSNQTILLGPNAGAVNPKSATYLFRIEGDKFFEVHGMLKGDTARPTLKVWERLKDDAAPGRNP